MCNFNSKSHKNIEKHEELISASLYAICQELKRCFREKFFQSKVCCFPNENFYSPANPGIISHLIVSIWDRRGVVAGNK